MNVDELIEHTQRHAGFRTNTTIDSAWYLAAINHGYRELATFQGEVRKPGRDKSERRRVRFLELEDTDTIVISANPASNFTAQASDVFAILSLYNTTDGRPVNRTSRASMEARNSADTGSVLLWVPGGRSNVAGFEFWARPTVSTTLTARVYKYPETLTAGVGVPVIPAEWHECIHLFAGSQLCTMLKMYEDADKLLMRAHNFIANRKSPHEETETFGARRFVYVGGR